MVKRLRVRGFSLIEMIIILSIISIMMVLTFTQFNTNKPSHVQGQLEINHLKAVMYQVQSNAIIDEKDYSIMFDIAKDQLAIKQVKSNNLTIHSLNLCNIKSAHNVSKMIYRPDGTVNTFGTVIIACGQDLYHMKIMLEKGLIEIERIKEIT
ncbi:prepilin-type N-terminal cleavage/methylation domain-containing protein [Abyssicoccus albus]|uniref:Prepilin-type N-terminal cleavage/methylation domain-containing protein n=2 Tax=Abyssicoccus albus TaxID=1817405 RepID=A0A3N5BKA1_9BACL|nr:prepilin-type N-terminal cleavage/methylation domain-containing protein [Abyssicoccus albus]